jgi:hypothetical protein
MRCAVHDRAAGIALPPGEPLFLNLVTNYLNAEETDESRR